MPKWTPIKGHKGLFTYKTDGGVRYAARRTYTDSLGRRHEWSSAGLKQWREADQALKQFEADLANGKPGPIENPGITVSQYHERLVERKMDLGIWQESTRATQQNYYDKYVAPAFGSMRLSEISRSQYQAYLDGLATEYGLAASTIKTIDSIMKSIMNEAANEDVIDKNRLRGLHLGGKPARNKTLTNQEVEKWLATAHRILDKYQLALVLTDALGLRKGEVMGLRTNSISITHDEVNDRDQAAIKIDLQRTTTKLNGGKLKTPSSYRTIWVFGEMVGLLKFAKVTANNLRTRNHIQSANHWLWVDNDGEPFYPDYLNRVERKVSKECGIEIYPHLLRHYLRQQPSPARNRKST